MAARLDQVSETDIDATIEMAIDKALTGGGIYSYVQLRVNGNQGYRLRVRAETTKTSLHHLPSGQRGVRRNCINNDLRFRIESSELVSDPIQRTGQRTHESVGKDVGDRVC